MQIVSDRQLVVKCEDGGTDYYADPELLDRATPRTPARVRLLSPFDNAVIQRDRNVALHEYDYQIECYVPAPKRRFGYFCLPILYRDRFVGRVDCKAHRQLRRLDLVHLHIERDIGDREQFLGRVRRGRARVRRVQRLRHGRLSSKSHRAAGTTMVRKALSSWCLIAHRLDDAGEQISMNYAHPEYLTSAEDVIDGIERRDKRLRIFDTTVYLQPESARAIASKAAATTI